MNFLKQFWPLIRFIQALFALHFNRQVSLLHSIILLEWSSSIYSDKELLLMAFVGWLERLHTNKKRLFIIIITVINLITECSVSIIDWVDSSEDTKFMSNKKIWFSKYSWASGNYGRVSDSLRLPFSQSAIKQSPSSVPFTFWWILITARTS